MKYTLLGSAALFLLQTLSIVTADGHDHHDHHGHQKNEKPNIVFIFTDDQDARLGSIDYMPNLQKHLVNKGTVYRNHYASIAVCCPSRVSLLRGQYSHNTNITDVGGAYGGYKNYDRLGLGDSTLPVWLQQAGYSTNYVGKLMNGYSVNNYNKPVPKGFDYQDQLVDPYTYVYNQAVFSKNGEAPVYYKNAYQTDVVHAKALKALKNQRGSVQPFFLWVAPMAPHGQFIIKKDAPMVTEPPVPAARHAHLFKDVKIKRTPNFNPSKLTKTASFWKELSQLNDTVVNEFDEIHRNRLRALQAVDEMIGSLIRELKRQGKLDNTYIIYSADNGYHIGQHRSYPGKCGNIEEDINVPFIVRGPGIPKGEVSDIVSGHHDIAPTFLALAKSSHYVPGWVDGGVIPLTKELRNHAKPVSKESFAVEFWMDSAMPEFYPGADVNGVNTYKTIRVISKDYNYMYSVWCTGEHEFYDLKKDPYETHNAYDEINPQLANRLDALLLVLKTCRAESCRNPWQILHPADPSVTTLADALHSKYDKQYSQYRKVAFSECLSYYSIQNEQPVVGNHFIANTTVSGVSKLTKAEKVIQKVLRSSLELPRKWQHTDSTHSSYDEDDHLSFEEVVRLHQLVPAADHQDLVGRELLPDDFENNAQPVPQELLDTQVNWLKHGFYSPFGN